MSEESKELQVIDWRRTFAFLEILRSFRMAVHPISLLLCFLGLAATLGAGMLIDKIPGIGQVNVNDRSFFENLYAIGIQTLWGEWALPYVDGKSWDDFLAFLLAPLTAVRELVVLIGAYWTAQKPLPWFALVNTIVGLAIWALVGGAVTRMAAVRVAREEGVPWRKAVGFAMRKWPSTVTSPLIPFGVLVLLAVLVGLPNGLFLMVPYVGEFVVGLLWGLSLAVFFIMALIFVGGVFSIGLQWPTIAAEGSDSFDAISRSISYISSRPWRYLFYTLFSALYGCLTFVFVKFLTFLTLRIGHTAVSTFSWGTDDNPDKLVQLLAQPQWNAPWPVPGATDVGWPAYFFAFWVWVVLGMMIAFLISFFFTSQTLVYFLLRKTVDATDIEEVYMEESDEEELPLQPGAAESPAGEGAETTK